MCLMVLAVFAMGPLSVVNAQSRFTSIPAESVEVFRCNFGQDWDVNYDNWPDRWTRHEGPKHPHYVQIGIADAPAIESGKCIEIKLDNARARIASPPIAILPKFRYDLRLKLKTENLVESNVVVIIDFLNRMGKLRHTMRSEPYQSTNGWTEVSLNTRPAADDIDRAVIRFEVDRNVRGDLHGTVCLADLWLARLPSMQVATDSPYNVYTDPRDVKVICALSGIKERDPEIRFQLLDATTRAVGAMGVKEFQGDLIEEASKRASDIVDGVGDHQAGYEGETEWHPEIEKHGTYGFYHVLVKMISSQTGEEMYRDVITLAVIPPRQQSQRGEFGWTLPQDKQPLSLTALEGLLPQMGVSWLKIPVWFSQDNPAQGERLIRFAERLAANDIETIGIITKPNVVLPGENSRSLAPSDEPAIANLFSADPSTWMPLYDHIMTRLSLRIRYWQLGVDHDTSFVGYDDLQGHIKKIRKQLYRFGQDVQLGLGWRWDQPLLTGPLTWDFQQLSAKPPLTSKQLGQKLAASHPSSVDNWVLVEPLAQEEIPDELLERAEHDKLAEAKLLALKAEQHQARVRSFIEQIVIAKQHRASGIFISNPYTGPNGLMTTEGKPGELLLPWRTASTLLGGATYLGKIQLPRGSENWLFSRQDGQVVMVLWNDTPVEEVMYLGDNLKQINVWGKEIPYKHNDYRQVVSVGPLPTFLVGVNEQVARWRMGVRFDETRVPSIPGVEHPNALTLTNRFTQGVGGTVRIVVPDQLRPRPIGQELSSEQWLIDPERAEFSLAAGSQTRVPLTMSLTDAMLGDQVVRIDFEIEAEQPYRFSVWRRLSVGLGDVQIKIHTHLDKYDRLVVTQQMINADARPADFKCFVYAPSRRRKRAQVFQLTDLVDEKVYTYTEGKALLGREITLQAEEIGGPRVLIHRFIAQPAEPPPAVTPTELEATTKSTAK